MAMDKGIETWENPNECLVAVVGLDHRGNYVDRLVNPHRRVNLTPEERELNEAMCALETLNPFRNGLLRLVKAASAATYEDLEPPVVTENAKSDEDFIALLKKVGVAFKKELEKIDSEIALSRFSRLAEEHGSVKQKEAIDARLEEVAPKLTKVELNTSIPEDQRKNFT
jgi:tRNA(His) 5'-end guanylyltransferase